MSAPLEHPASARRRIKPSTWVAALGSFVIMAAAIGIMFSVLSNQGIGQTGDAPHYLAAAFGLIIFHSLSVTPVIKAAGSSGLYDGIAVTGQEIHSHGQIFINHSMGLPVLLAIPVAIGKIVGAQVFIALFVAGLTVVLVAFTARLTSVTAPWRFAIIGLFLSPAYLLAATQIYPDLISGIMVATVIMSMARIEQTGVAPARHVIAWGVVAGALLSLHPQNEVYVFLLVLAAIVLHLHLRLPRRPLVIAGVITAAFWVLGLLWNLLAFGRIFAVGGSQKLSFQLLGITRMVALVVDNQQGILIQLPVILLGIAALWLVRRRMPISTILTVLFVGAVISLNGSIGGSLLHAFGGLSFVGRFEWSAGPVLLAYAGFYLLDHARRRLAWAIGIAVLYLIQLLPILRNEHIYYWNGLHIPEAGWWPLINHSLPTFGEITGAWDFSRTWGATILVLTVAALAVVLLVRPPTTVGSGTAARGVTVLAFVAVTWTLLAGNVGFGTISYPGAMLPAQIGHTLTNGDRVVAGGHQPGLVVWGPSVEVPRGSYDVTVTYSLVHASPRSAPIDIYIAPGPQAHAGQTLRSSYLPPGAQRTATYRVTIPQTSYLYLGIGWNGPGALRVEANTIAPASRAVRS